MENVEEGSPGKTCSRVLGCTWNIRMKKSYSLSISREEFQSVGTIKTHKTEQHFIFLLNFYFYFILLYNTVLVLPYIDMNQPRVPDLVCVLGKRTETWKASDFHFSSFIFQHSGRPERKQWKKRENMWANTLAFTTYLRVTKCRFVCLHTVMPNDTKMLQSGAKKALLQGHAGRWVAHAPKSCTPWRASAKHF